MPATPFPSSNAPSPGAAPQAPVSLGAGATGGLAWNRAARCASCASLARLGLPALRAGTGRAPGKGEALGFKLRGARGAACCGAAAGGAAAPNRGMLARAAALAAS